MRINLILKKFNLMQIVPVKMIINNSSTAHKQILQLDLILITFNLI